jgi:hypothetical protein
VGRWSVDPERRALMLWDVGGKALAFEILGNQRLRPVDIEGHPIASEVVYELISQGALEPLNARLLIGGMLFYMADAARLTECRTGRSYPVARQGDYRRLEKGLSRGGRTAGRAAHADIPASRSGHASKARAPKRRRSSSGSSCLAGRDLRAQPIACLPRCRG